MRGNPKLHNLMIFGVHTKQRLAGNHLLRAVKVLQETERSFDAAYREEDHPSSPPDALLKALLQILYSIPSARRPLEALN